MGRIGQEQDEPMSAGGMHEYEPPRVETVFTSEQLERGALRRQPDVKDSLRPQPEGTLCADRRSGRPCQALQSSRGKLEL
jgi:hypothetical protein